MAYKCASILYSDDKKIKSESDTLFIKTIIKMKTYRSLPIILEANDDIWIGTENLIFGLHLKQTDKQNITVLIKIGQNQGL